MTDASAQSLLGRRIVVTGASSGIGRSTVRRFVAEGATPILLDLNEAGMAETLDGNIGLSYTLDITDHGAVQTAVDKAASELGGIDGIVNAAGIMLVGPTADFSFEAWHKTININLTGTFNVAKCCIEHLKKQSGSTIVNIASGAGLLPNAPGLAAYAASKGGVISLTRALASDLAPNIRVNCVCPGLVNTPLANDFIGNIGNYALKRFADPEEIANVILFLTSGQSSYVTGASLAADGGRTYH
jgi:NAD(P)-dependent dehydrogenase (short-subunit alcohol dehydrogenase family)